jgi:hypothetical protein
MIDNTLVRMIDEMLRRLCKSSAFPPQEMLEVRANRAHLMCRPSCFASSPIPRDFVRDLFTINRIAAFVKVR